MTQLTTTGTSKIRMSTLTRLLLLVAALLLVLPTQTRAAETAETILIRAALGKDLSGRRRGDVELLVQAYDQDRFVVYDGGTSASAAGWTPLVTGGDAYGEHVAQQLQAHRFDISRAVVFINVWDDKAFVTTTDSGSVIDRESGVSSDYFERRLWTFFKQDEEWLATGLINAYGDTTDSAPVTGIADEQVAQMLRDEAAAWTDGSAGDAAGVVDEEFVAVESLFSANPAKWLIVFGDKDEYREWLDERFERLDYNIEREILHVAVGAAGGEAVAVTRDQIRATPNAGSSAHEQERVSYWLLQQQGGNWVVTWVFWKSKAIPGSTAALN
ncbi:MAG: hypothetical protein HOM68_19515 [Gemmatimonadetes bacterium]|jgi:hypothetical protein|nr:hypothetical protein [Gemmatimonadota bacterium]MBT5144269.1 hypothetical protein [Gemmatimonadota bacterium]MBT5588705.1 hypothetical protein [Gemmatimonadota bacterium]MBT5964577.1 hypothetical protein [Gemmatimonadota bacterium]MBT7457802.1 hypothetical protein [Gemmatimonadota bacterium]